MGAKGAAVIQRRSGSEPMPVFFARSRYIYAFAFVAPFTPCFVRAQTVTGRIVAKSDGAPVGGAIVALVDSSGRAVATRLVEDAGTFSFTAPVPGTYSVRVDRVGFRSNRSAPFLVRQGQTVDVPVTVASEGVSLRAVKVSADRRCLVRPQEGLAAAQLWDEARKALNATQLTQLAQAGAKGRRDRHRFVVRWRKTERQLEPSTLAPVHDEQVELEGETVTPFISLDPEILARDGYMSGQMENGSTYYAPDAVVLLSDRFLDTHCFRLQAPGHNQRDDLIGLAFEPVNLTSDGQAKRVEVRGVLWLDRASAELRYMQYGYVNLPFSADADHAGGLLEFRPLPDGRWIVWRWYIRMPQFERRPNAIDPVRPEDWHLEMLRVHEEGAEVVAVKPAGTLRSATATLRGTVMDSLRGSAIAGARVFLSGTTFAAVTDADGSFVIDSIPPGRYLASILTPRVDSLLLDPPSRELTLNAGEEKTLDLALPSLRSLSAKLCSAPVPDSASMIVGVVRDSGLAAPGVNVRAEWKTFDKDASDRLRIQALANETSSAAGGRYALCGLPPDTRITVRASRGRTVIVSPQRPSSRGEVRRLDLTLRKP